MKDSSKDEIRQQCWDRALEAFGTAYIFQERANQYKIQLRLLTFLGIVIPLAAGGVVLAFGTGVITPAVLIPAGILGVLQLIGSLWSLVAKWDDSYSYSIESANSNYKLSNEYKRLAEQTSEKSSDLMIQYNLISKEDEFRNMEDTKQGISEKEKRKGMRTALRQFRRACAGCGKIPTTMKPTNCSVCGQY